MMISDQRSVVENLVETMTVVIVVTVEGIITVGAGIVIGIMIGIVMTGNALETQIALMILEIVTVHAHGQQTMNIQGTMIVTSAVTGTKQFLLWIHMEVKVQVHVLCFFLYFDCSWLYLLY